MEHKQHNGIFCVCILFCYIFFVCFFAAGIRSTISEQEGRKLAQFPKFTIQSYLDGSFTSGITAWFSDTVPERDSLMSAAMNIQTLKGCSLRGDGEEIAFHGFASQTKADNAPGADNASKGTPDDGTAVSGDGGDGADMSAEGSTGSADGAPAAHKNETIEEEYTTVEAEDFTTVSNGIIVTGSGNKTRAMMLYGGSTEVTTRYAETANHYKEQMPELNVYVMVIPTAISYYCPASVEDYTKSQADQINNVISHLRDDVVGLNVYSAIGEHRDEDIYLRTDHHWAPRGAYYAASELAKAAGVPFLDLEKDYETGVVHNYVGTMYMYAQDARIRNNPEDFIYYIPKDVELTTTYINCKLDSNWKVVGEDEPIVAPFYIKQPDGSRDAYSIFMGGDAKTTKVETSTRNGRKLLIIKDSFGNALPEFLFGSFEELHIIDSRYFIHNVKDFVKENGITDLLFANNAFHAATKSTVDAYERYLVQ